MALGIAAVVPPQLAERALVERKDALVESIRPGAEELVGSGDTFYSVPITARFARQALTDPDGACAAGRLLPSSATRAAKSSCAGSTRTASTASSADGPGLPSQLHAAAPPPRRRADLAR